MAGFWTSVQTTSKKYFPLLILAVVWEVASRSGIVSQYALPPLSRIIASFDDVIQASYFMHAGMSLARSFGGLFAAILLGTTLGVLMATSRWVNLLIGPVVQTLYPMPKSALIPLTILWFGLGHSSKVFLILIGCLLPIIVSTINGVRGVDRTMIWSGSSLGASRFASVIDIAIPAAMPTILAGVRTAMALSFVLLVSSELVMSNEGLGYLIRMLGDGGLYAEMFGVILSVVAMGFAADRFILFLTHRILRWQR